MKNRYLFMACALCVFMPLSLCYVADALAGAKVSYGFYGGYFLKIIKKDGQFLSREKFCENKINVKDLNIYEGTIEPIDTFVSPDEHYFVFAGAKGRHADRRWFLVDISSCKVMRELVIGDPTYRAYGYNAAFSPDSTKLYVSYLIGGERRYLTREYSGEGFGNERVMQNLFIPMTVGVNVKPYRFTNDGGHILVHNMTSQWYLNLIVYDVQKDEEVFRTDNIKEYLGKSAPLMGQEDENEYVPYIDDGRIIFNVKKDSGSEINIFDYKEKKIKKKIQAPNKGVGRFSSKGDRVVFTEFTDPKTKKKKAIVFETETGKQLGNTVLDEEDEAIDVTDDGKEFIIKRDKAKKRVKVE